MAGVEQSKRLVTESDIHLVYDLFLDQIAVSPDTISKRVGADPAKFLQLLFGQQRFRRNVIDRLNAGSSSLGGAKQRTVRSEEVAQLADMLSLPGLPELFAEPDVPRDDFFRRLLTWPGFLDLFTDETRTSLRLKKVGRAAVDRRIAGEIDGCFGIEVTGWAFNLVDPAEKLVVEIVANGHLIGSAVCDVRRRDVPPDSATGPDIGFSFTLPLDVDVTVGASDFWLTVRDSISKQPISAPLAVRLSTVASQGTLALLHQKLATLSAEIESLSRLVPRVAREASYRLEHYSHYHAAWLCLTPAERAEIQQASNALRARPTVSIVLDGTGVTPSDLLPSVRSITEQIYDQWELLLFLDGPNLAAELDRLALDDATRARIRILETEEPDRATRLNGVIKTITGALFGVMKIGDRLAPDALFHYVTAAQDNMISLCYADADLVQSEEGRDEYRKPIFKPGLDRDLLLQEAYIGFYLVRTSLLSRLEQGFSSEADGVEEYDLLLRALTLIEDAGVRHIARILSHHPVPASDAVDATLPARLRVVQRHLDETAPDTFAGPQEQAGARSVGLHITRPLPDEPPAVTIVVPTRDRLDLLRPCIESIVASQSGYAGPVQIMIVDNGSAEAETALYLSRLQKQGLAEILPYPHPFNWAQMNNLAAREASGDILIFLNNDVVVSSFTWIAELVREVVRPEVGAVGARLLFQNGAIQHAGVLGGIGGIAVHDGLGCRAGDDGYLERNARLHGAIAVTGACMCVRASLFDAFGGFDADTFAVAFNDLDFCLRLRAAGYRVLYTPHATLFHFESQSRGIDDTLAKQETNRRERAAFTAKWGKLTFADPFYNANFDRASLPFSAIRPIGS